MSKTVIDQRSSVALPPEALDALGVEAGAELEMEIVGRALVVRSVEEARRSREFVSAFDSILSRRRTAYAKLAKGHDYESPLMTFPEKLDVLTVHATLIAETGGTGGLRDEDLLESALAAAE